MLKKISTDYKVSFNPMRSSKLIKNSSSFIKIKKGLSLNDIFFFPGIPLTMSRGRKKILHSTGNNDLKSCIAAIFGSKFLLNLDPLDGQNPECLYVSTQVERVFVFLISFKGEWLCVTSRRRVWSSNSKLTISICK